MTPEDLRNILALAAVEETDEGGVLLSSEVREEASRAAGAPLPGRPGRDREERFLAERARDLLDRLASRYPGRADWLDPAKPAHLSHHPGWIALLLLVAGVFGFLTNELGPEKRINILSFPLLGILAWSLLVYCRDAVLLLGRFRSRLVESGLAFLERRRGASEAPAGSAESVLEASRALFERRWRRRSAPVAWARLKSLLHVAAFVLAASAVGGMYVKGLANEYKAVWESTFITESGQLLPVLRFVLGPAVSISGGELPSVGELEAIRGATAEGENAARWIHWYALTIGLFVLLPRAVLAVLWRVRAATAASRFGYRETAPKYYGRLLATSFGSSRRVVVVPYQISPDAAARSALARRLEDEFSAAVEVEWRPTVPFGEEESAALDPVPEDAEVILLFSFSATPERETHLALHRTLSGAAPNPVRWVLLDAAAFDRKSQALADAAERRAAREAAWRKLFVEAPVALLVQPESEVPATR
ncbi:MAG TPA: DUF2868 domain-containing protein [Bacteroidia bacterium]|nr:DUF2868 domain-containing protein [Bacteroidia bacterium]